jgi:hypothetical protein
MTSTQHPSRRAAIRSAGVAAATVAAVLLAGCGGSSTSGSASGQSTTTTIAAGATDTSQVLPVTDNPIKNDATAATLKIDSVLVENNVDPDTGKAADDHLEIALSNTGTTELGGVEVFYTFDDPTAQQSESYYTKLPADFTIPAGGTRTVHFDNSGAVDHFPVNKFSLYSTSTNAMDVTVVVSAQGAAVQTATVKKDAGGAENPDE